jgi:hypothetical protein
MNCLYGHGKLQKNRSAYICLKCKRVFVYVNGDLKEVGLK